MHCLLSAFKNQASITILHLFVCPEFVSLQQQVQILPGKMAPGMGL
jgi:hypothetical protein